MMVRILIVALMVIMTVNNINRLKPFYWIHADDRYLVGTYRARYQHATLDAAKSQCLKMDDCKGITLYKGQYQLKRSNILKVSRYGLESWVKMRSIGMLRWTRPQRGKSLSGVVNGPGYKYRSFEDATLQCMILDKCNGITLRAGMYELRAGKELIDSPNGDTSWRLLRIRMR